MTDQLSSTKKLASAEKSDSSGAALRAVKSSERTLHLLEVLSAHPGPVPITELHRLTGYPRSSLHQLLHTMAQSDWIEMSADGTHAAIGSRALIVGTSYLDHDAALRSATAALERIREETGYTAHYARLNRSEVLYLATRETTHSRRATSRVGRSLPAHATALGKVLLAERTPQERDEVLSADPLVQLTPNTISTREALEAQLDAIDARRWAVEYEENTLGVCCVAAAVPYRIPATDAISCSIPVAHASAEEIDSVAKVILAVTNDLARSLQRDGVR
ncbi:MAG TPA: IclR family transcriptional regulator [Glaciihabitans sp.]|nr:IclR family transcriptional regulator [Glaciihabitans sp.]